MEELAAVLSAFHAKNPKRMREQLMRLSAEMLNPRPRFPGPEQVKRMLGFIPGVAVKEGGQVKMTAAQRRYAAVKARRKAERAQRRGKTP